MYINNRLHATLYKLLIAALSGVGVWIEFTVFGEVAWRWFSTWTLAFIATYYVFAFIKVAFWRKAPVGRVFCPLWQGAVVVAGIMLTIGRMVFDINHIELGATSGLSAILIYWLIPLLVVCDWILFTKKGLWKLDDPFYWLAMPVIYTAWLLLSAEFMAGSDMLRYPYEFINLSDTNIDRVLWWLVVISVATFSGSYLLIAIDYALSGKMSKHIVMPRIKTIVIEEELPVTEEAIGDEIVDIVEPIEQKTVANPKPNNKSSKKDKQSSVIDSVVKVQETSKTESIKEAKDNKSAQKLHSAKNTVKNAAIEPKENTKKKQLTKASVETKGIKETKDGTKDVGEAKRVKQEESKDDKTSDKTTMVKTTKEPEETKASEEDKSTESVKLPKENKASKETEAKEELDPKNVSKSPQIKKFSNSKSEEPAKNDTIKKSA